MKFLWISPNGDTVDVAWRVKLEGNEVKYFIPKQKMVEPELEKVSRETGEGFIEKIPSYEPAVSWADIIVIDAKGQGNKLETGKLADTLKKRGKMVVGAGEQVEKMEMDRDFGQSVLRAHGVEIVPTYKFNNFDEGKKFISENPGKYVVKPNADIDSQFTVVGKEEGGSGVPLDREAYLRSVEFWRNHATIQ